MDCLLVLCGHGETKDFTVTSLVKVIQTSKYKYDVAYQSGDALIGRSRSIACTSFLKNNVAPYMIFIDTDILFTVEEIDKLYEAMLKGYDVIGGAYSVASGDRLAIRGMADNIVIDGRIIEVEYVSTGFMGISRKALEQIRDKCSTAWDRHLGLPLLHEGDWCECYPFFESGATNLTKEKFYISEDWDFCNKARDAGMKVYFHTGCLVDHIKTNIINAEQMLATHNQPKVFINPDVGLLNDMAEFLGKPFDEIKNAVLNYKMKDNKTDEDWMIELAQFNSFDYYPKQRVGGLVNIDGLRILDYGSGIGTAAIQMSNRNSVVGYDQNKKLVEFSNYRAKKHGVVNATFVSEEPDLSQFHLITFIDVLEHFEDLQTFIKHIGEKIQPGTKIYHFDAFFDHATPGHFDHSAKINEYLKEAGIIPFDGLWAVKA